MTLSETTTQIRQIALGSLAIDMHSTYAPRLSQASHQAQPPMTFDDLGQRLHPRAFLLNLNLT